MAALHKQCSDVLALRQNVLDAAGRHSGGADPMGECAAVASLLRYYRLLCSLETRFESHELRLVFPWRDAFQPNAKQAEADLRYERSCTLFNLASLVSTCAANQDRADPEGLKRACTLFQQAAHLLSLLPPLVGGAAWGGKTTTDIHKGTLDCLQDLMLAQAQRCFYEKAVRDSMSPKLLAKVAKGAADLYEQALGRLHAPELHSHIERCWAAVVGWNHALYLGLSQFHASFEHADAYEYGQQVARLQYAEARLGEVAKLSERDQLLGGFYKAEHARVAHMHATAAKDNATVYMESVPPLSTLPPVSGKVIVKPLAWTHLQLAMEMGGGAMAMAMPTAADGDDPFSRLVPVAVQRELQRCAAGCQAIAEAIFATLEGAVQEGDRQLMALDLPHALQAVEQSALTSTSIIPSQLQEEVRHVHANGGELSLRSSIAALAQLTDTCEASVATVRAELAVEEQEDAAMRGKYGDRWEIVASDAMTQDAQAELHLCEDRLLLAAGANQQVAASFAESRDAISPLELTLEELLARVPHSGGSPLAGLACTAELRRRLDTLEAVRGGRRALLARCSEEQGLTRTVQLEKVRGQPMGISLKPRTQAGLPGLEVSSVAPGSAAARGGVLEGDVLLMINATAAISPEQVLGVGVGLDVGLGSGLGLGVGSGLDGLYCALGCGRRARA